MAHIDVLIAGSATDVHCATVAAALKDAGAAVALLPMSAVRHAELRWLGESGSVHIRTSRNNSGKIDASTSVWWRRPGRVETEDLAVDEARFVVEEVESLWPGVLEAVGVRWVDAPWTLGRARLKPVQLAAAVGLGLRVPRTAVFGDVSAARDFCASQSVVAKATSSGIGIAPFVAHVPPMVLDLAGACPTCLQQFVVADADARIVTIGSSSFCWVRERDAGTVDWRRCDPAGRDFRLAQDVTFGLAARLSHVLGLSMSVQDWLLTPDGPVFLEVNPQGQFLFLADAVESALPALVEHLCPT